MVGGLLTTKKKYMVLWYALSKDFQKKLIDKSWNKLHLKKIEILWVIGPIFYE